MFGPCLPIQWINYLTVVSDEKRLKGDLMERLNDGLGSGLHAVRVYLLI